MPNTDAIIVHKDRTNIVYVSLGIDVSSDTITSEIRTRSGDLIATWTVSFDGDGTDGELILTLDDADVDDIIHSEGVMDLKRVSAGQPLPVHEDPIEVVFKATVTV